MITATRSRFPSTAGQAGDACLAPPWSGAASALMNAAMALGAPELVAPVQRASLLRAWSALRVLPHPDAR